MEDSSPQMVVASRFPPTYRGGLAGYQRKLAELFTRETGKTGIFLASELEHPELPAIENAPPWPLSHLPLTLLGRIALPLAPSLASRSSTRRILIWLLERSWRMPSHLNPSAIHFAGTGWDFAGFFLSAIARKAGIPFGIMPAVHAGTWGDDAIDIALYQQAGVVFCQTNHERDHLLARGVPAAQLRKISQVPLCRIDGDGARLRSRWNLAQRPCVLFLGRRDAGKGYTALLSAWQIVLRDQPDAVLLVAGPPRAGMELGALQDLPPDSIRDLGVVSERDKADALAACTIFCLPSANESFGIAYIEAWSYGKPVVCGPSPASREIVEDGVAGYWADQNPESIAAKLLCLLDDPERAQGMGETGRGLQKTQYGDRQLIDPFLESAGIES